MCLHSGCVQAWPKNILVDAGPLIALGRKADEHHGRALAFAAQCESRMVSSWAVVAEAAHFLDSHQRVNIYRILEDGFLHLKDVRDSDATRYVQACCEKFMVEKKISRLVAGSESTRVEEVAGVVR